MLPLAIRVKRLFVMPKEPPLLPRRVKKRRRGSAAKGSLAMIVMVEREQGQVVLE